MIRRTRLPARTAPLQRGAPPKRGALKRKPPRKNRELDIGRVEAHTRAQGRCEVKWGGCQGRGVHAHHKRLRSQGGGHGADNLLWVCAQCHTDIHAHRARAKLDGHILEGRS